MRKIVVFLTAVLLSIGSQAMAIDFPEGASPYFFESPTAYSSQYFNRILEAHTLQFDVGTEKIPSTYAKIGGGKATFNAVSTVYSPWQYHDILTSYGLELSPERVKNVLKVGSYAKVAGDTITFGTSPTAYGGPEWKNILETYTLPAPPVPVVKPKMEKAPPPPPVAKPGDDDGDGVTNDKDACPDTPRFAAVDDRGCWALSSKLLFDFDKAVIKPEFYSLLDNTRKVFDEYPNMRVTVEGHADSTGTDEYNLDLSQRRAQAVVDYLIQKVGIAVNRLEAVGYGESRPAYSNDTKEGQAKNRRVEFSPMK